MISSTKPRTALLELVDVDAHDCSGEALWMKFVECLTKHQIPITNILGLASDNAAVMVGNNNSFWTRLLAVCPWAVKLSCICHTSALISKSACKALPTFVQAHLRSLLTYISASPKRTAELTDFEVCAGTFQSRETQVERRDILCRHGLATALYPESPCSLIKYAL